MYHIIYLLIISVCLGISGFIVFKKIPRLINLDLENLPEEKIAKKKKEIISKRAEERSVQMVNKMSVCFSPLKKVWGFIQLRFRIYVGKIQRMLHHEQVSEIKASPKGKVDKDKEERIKDLIREAANFVGEQDYDHAEDLYISAIGLNPKNKDAYRGLADCYFKKGSLEEAFQTYEFILQLTPNDDNVLVKMAEIEEERGNFAKAIEYYQRAVLINDNLPARFFRLSELLLKEKQPRVAREAVSQAIALEPQNPKYLDLLVEIGIMSEDKKTALKAYNELRLVNPENNKLDILKERISKIK